jgi:hypothetical protein
MDARYICSTNIEVFIITSFFFQIFVTSDTTTMKRFILGMIRKLFHWLISEKSFGIKKFVDIMLIYGKFGKR